MRYFIEPDAFCEHPYPSDLTDCTPEELQDFLSEAAGGWYDVHKYTDGGTTPIHKSEYRVKGGVVELLL